MKKHTPGCNLTLGVGRCSCGGVPMTIMKADRSYSNESAGRGMWGALVREGVVLCYFPDQRAAFRIADLLDIRMPSLYDAVAAVAWEGPAASRARRQT